MAVGAMNITGVIMPVHEPAESRRSAAMAGFTPEFYFPKVVDNSRLVKVVDPRRRREIRMFSASVAALTMLPAGTAGAATLTGISCMLDV